METKLKLEFEENLKGFDMNTLEELPDTIYGLNKDLLLAYYNPGWHKFSKENNEEPNLSEDYPIGTPIEKCLLGEMKSFYIENYKKVLKSGKVWHHEYECSSPKEMRIFTQSTYPLRNKEGLVIVNRLRKVGPINRPLISEKEFNLNDYTHDTGFIHQCSNCRCIQRVDDERIWEWIEKWVIKFPENTSHSICQTCFDYYWKYSG